MLRLLVPATQWAAVRRWVLSRRFYNYSISYFQAPVQVGSVQEALHLFYFLFSGTCLGGRRRRTTCRCSLEPPGDDEEEEVFVSVPITSGWAVSSETR